MKNNFNFFFLIIMIMSTLFLISSNSWFNLWIWLEINLISFIAFLINNKLKMSIESSLIYFLIQTIASILLLFSIIMMMFYYNLFKLMMISMLIKLGSAPFHYWLPMMIEGLNWQKIFFLLTWQKINPLIMLYYNNNMNFLNFFIIFSLIIGSIMGLNYSSLKKMMSFSSINQLSWMMISIMNNNIMKIYIFIYFFLMLLITKSLKMFNLNFINQIYNMNMNLKNLNLYIFMNFLSLGGLPPFLGFFPKLMIINMFNNYLMMLLMILFTLITLFMYIRMIFSIMLLNSLKSNKLFKNYNKNNKMMKMFLIILMLNNFFLMMLFIIF